ncbi:hypothetical protein BGZ82_008063 [Podila clonocystis]|nr:hypothetical protein BGZ82_008063 [Podila clonocystis]
MVKKSTFPSMGFKRHGLPSFLRSKPLAAIGNEYRGAQDTFLTDHISHHAPSEVMVCDRSERARTMDTLSYHSNYPQPRSQDTDQLSTSMHKTILFSDPTSSPTPTKMAIPFHGLPLEIIQYIAGFMSFRTLVLVYKSFPKIHRPLLRQILDHSLALMILTLEIRQQQYIELLPGTVNHQTPAHFLEETTLTTQWRATDFDLEQWTVEFQLEEKLGLQMAAKRRHEILQQQELQHSTSAPSSSNCGPCSLGSSNPPQKRAHMAPEDIEYVIWKARSRPRTSTEGAVGGAGPGTGASEEEVMQSLLMEDTPQEAFDNNFFHCNGSDFPPTLASASISFKANRNSPAPWVSHRIELGPHSSSDSASILSPSESPKTICALERIAAFQQNRVLQRSLAKMVCRNELNMTQFLPMPVALETSDLGQKRVEAFLLPPRPMSISEHESRRSSQELSSSSPPSSFSGSAVSLSPSNHGALPPRARRHSWHVTGPDTFAPRHTSIAATIKNLFKASSSSSSSSDGRISRSRSSLDLDNSNCSCPIVRGASHKANFWASMISGKASFSSRSTPMTNWPGSENCLVHRHVVTGRRTVHITSKSDPSVALPDGWGLGIKRKRSLPGCQVGEDKKPEEREEEATSKTTRQCLFEFQYGVRHNYMQTSRLEGERVVRPTLFLCSLDFFVDDV